MHQKEYLALILAGGKGKRLSALTDYMAKPAVYFGGNYRIIDFALSNCLHSGIDSIGVLTQHHAEDLHRYIDSIGLTQTSEGMSLYMRPPDRQDCEYCGTADAVYQNTAFIDRFDPETVLILAGDHIYKMDYRKLLSFHRSVGADITIASKYVPWPDTARFGILTTDESGRVRRFAEKPAAAESNLASMGIYACKWETLRRFLTLDRADRDSWHDFGRDIIPRMLRSGAAMYSYHFDGYWQDVGTVSSLWQSNMDLLRGVPDFDLWGDDWKIHTAGSSARPSYTRGGCFLNESIISGGCSIAGRVERSVLSDGVIVEEGAEVLDSVVMAQVYIGKNAKIHRAIVGPGVCIMDGVHVGTVGQNPDGMRDWMEKITLVAPWAKLSRPAERDAGDPAAVGAARLVKEDMAGASR